MEVETIPEYIEMYHRERNALKAKTAEKDKVISQMGDKQEKQRKVQKLALFFFFLVFFFFLAAFISQFLEWVDL